MRLPRLAFDWRFLGWSLTPAWILCMFNMNTPFSTQTGNGILSSPVWLAAALAYALSAAVSGVALSRVSPDRVRWMAWTGAVAVALGTLLAATSLGDGPSASLPVLVAEGMLCGTGLAWVSILWGFPLSTLSVEQVEAALLLYAGVSALCVVTIPLMPATARIAVTVCLPLISGASLLALYPAKTGAAAHAKSATDRHPSPAHPKVLGAVYLLCFASHVAIGYIDTIAGNVCGAETMLPTLLTGAVVGIAFATIAVMRSVRIDVYPSLRWAIPLLCAATALSTAWPTGATSIELACVVCIQAIIYAYFVDQGRRGALGLMPGLGIAICSMQMGINAGAVAGAVAAASAATEALFAVSSTIACLLCLSMAALPVLNECKAPLSETVYEELEAKLPSQLVGVCDRYGLTPRERDVFAYLIRGRSQPYIREALLLSKSTVATHVRHIYQKFGVHARSELVELIRAQENDAPVSRQAR